MALTPVTREEYYLAKAGGQDVPTPSPVPREEQYLARLSGQDVNVPTPITRREKFLYAASGGDIELPSEDKMRRIEKFMAKAGGRDVTTPTPVPREEQFWDAIVAESGIKTLTGRLPLFFRTSERKLRDWTIYGNNNVGKNLLDITDYDRTHYTVRWYEDNGQLKASGTYAASAAHTWPRFLVELSAGTYTLSGSPDYEQSGVQLQIGTCTDAQGSNFTSLGFDTGSGYTFTLQDDSWVSIRVYTASSLYQQTVDLTLPLMLRKSGTSEAFEPYQIGVGEKTENIADVSKSGMVQINTEGAMRYGLLLGKLEPGNYTVVYTSETVMYITKRLSNNTYSSVATPSGTVIEITDSVDEVIFRTTSPTETTWEAMGVSDIMIVKGSTAPESYIPYGYVLNIGVGFAPIPSVNPVALLDTRKTIYIGESPLTEGQTLSMSEFGDIDTQPYADMFIAAFKGFNYDDQLSSNQPEMLIKYKEYKE